jgi:oxygen-independent coproporphyrinogen-3 oxidase
MDAYVDSLIKDITYQIDYFEVESVETVYIGGGTPSVLGAKRIGVLLENLAPFLKSCKEFTIEVNPESASEELISVCAAGGVTRISVGAQSFHEASRTAVNRKGDVKEMEKRLELIARFFSGSFSADLITGLPYQSEKTVLEDIKRILEYNPSHISLYSLTLEDETPLGRKVKEKTITLPSEDDALWLTGRDALKKAGYEHYEVSNFALSGKRCLHNLRYWNMETWLGAGYAASGTIFKDDTAKRYTYESDLRKYLSSPSIHSACLEEIDRKSLIKETLLMGYRLLEGPDKEKFRVRFGLGIEDCIGKTLERWKGKDITLFLNSFLSDAFNELN